MDKDNEIDIIVKDFSHKPKYLQIIYSVISLIEKGILKKGSQLPSITELSEKNSIAKVTVTKAYNHLRQQGVIISRHGKGFYVSTSNVQNKLNIFVLFDTFNSYKEVLFNSFKNALPADAMISMFFHSYNLTLFQDLITNNLGDFNYYVIMPHFNEDVSTIINKIPAHQLLLIDSDVPKSANKFAAVYQDFDTDLYNALVELKPRLKKYQSLNMILGKDRFQYIPDGIKRSFDRFCVDHPIHNATYSTLTDIQLEKGQVYLLFADSDMIEFIKKVENSSLKLGKDVGLISYDDTPLKSILMGGITVVTTDFELMGKTAGDYIKNKRYQKTANPYKLIVRRTV